MKKKGLLLTLVTAIMSVMMLLLCSCSTYGNVKAAFEKEGWTESEAAQTYQSQIMSYLNANSEEELTQVCNVHILAKAWQGVVFIAEFTSTEKMNEKIAESETLQGIIQDAQKSDYVNGNCVLLPILGASETVMTIFKNA